MLSLSLEEMKHLFLEGIFKCCCILLMILIIIVFENNKLIIMSCVIQVTNIHYVDGFAGNSYTTIAPFLIQ